MYYSFEIIVLYNSSDNEEQLKIIFRIHSRLESAPGAKRIFNTNNQIKKWNESEQIIGIRLGFEVDLIEETDIL